MSRNFESEYRSQKSEDRIPTNQFNVFVQSQKTPADKMLFFMITNDNAAFKSYKQ